MMVEVAYHRRAVQDRTDDRVLVLSETFRAFAEVTTDFTALVETIARKLTELIGDACVVALENDDGALFGPSGAYAGDPAARAALRDALNRRSERDGSGQSNRVARTGEPMLIPEIDPNELAERAEPAFADAVRLLGIRSFLSVPLEVRGHRLGVLSLFRYLPSSPPFGDYERALALSISDHAALAISNAHLFESLQRELRERQKAEERAKTFVALIENSTNFIAMADLTGRVNFINAAGRALVGLDPEVDAHTLTLADLHTADGMKRRELIRELGSWQGEGVLRHVTTGELIPTQVSSFLTRDTDGKPLCFATVQHDLRETKRLESELRQAQRIEALGRLAGGVAHDFNNLLTVILSYSAMLAKSLPREGRGLRDVEQIEHAAERAAELTRQLLAFSRRQVLEPKALDLGATVRGMDAMIRRLIGEDIAVRIVTSDAGSPVVADAGQIEQVVMNLVVNARDAMRGGGALELVTERVELDAAAAAAIGIAPGAYSTLSISDTGTGIDEQTKAQLFEPFFTTKPRGEGTGLGLSTVMGIVEQSGGHIRVDSELGRGTSFRIYLPATTGSPSARAATPRPSAAPRGIERIVVVEDEREVRALVCMVLRDAGYDVVEANDTNHALELAEDGADFDLLLTDVIMPGMSGRELAAQVMARRPTTRVLYMSGYTDDKLGHHGLLDPDVELIQKPLTPDALLRRVRAVLTRST